MSTNARKPHFYSELRPTNIVASGSLDTSIDTRMVAQHMPGSIFHSLKCGGLRVYFVHPQCSVTLQTTGRISVMGTRSEIETYLAFRKLVFLLAQYGIDARLSQNPIVISNFVCTGQTAPVNLVLMKELAPHAVRYEPEKFQHAAIVNVRELGFPDTRISIEIFQSGKYNMPGSRSMVESRNVDVFCEERLFSKVRISDSVSTEVSLLQQRQLAIREPKAADKPDEQEDTLALEEAEDEIVQARKRIKLDSHFI